MIREALLAFLVMIGAVVAPERAPSSDDGSAPAPVAALILIE